MMVPKSLYDTFESLWSKRVYTDLTYGQAFYKFMKNAEVTDYELEQISSLPYQQVKSWIDARLDTTK